MMYRFIHSRLAYVAIVGIGVVLAALPMGGAAFAIRQDTEKLPGGAFQMDVALRAHSSPEYLRRFSYAIGGKLVQHKRCERPTAMDPWSCWDASESTTYIVVALSSYDGGDELFVSGIEPDGASVIERWSYPRRKNGRHSFAPPLPSQFPVGAPLPAAAVQQQINGLQGWQQPAVGWTLPAAERTLLYKAVTGPFLDMAVDPQGRYLVYHDLELEKLFILSLVEPQATPVLLASSQTHPQLAQAGIIQVMDFSNQGRKLLVRKNFKSGLPVDDQVYTVFSDPENDGTFVLSASYDPEQWQQSEYSDWSLWDSYWHP